MTIDAMGCQTEIAQEIVDANADYVLAVKGNQPTLHEGIAEFFLKHLEDDFAGVKVSRYETERTWPWPRRAPVPLCAARFRRTCPTEVAGRN